VSDTGERHPSATARRRTTIGLLGAAGLGAAGLSYAALRARAARRRAVEQARAERAGALGGDELDLPPDTRHLDVPVRDGGSIHIADYGAGPPIVLLHGVTLQASVWAYQFRDLGDRHRMIALDLRGHGSSEPGDAGMSIAAMADDLSDVLEALDLRRATLVGHSMGGMTVLRFARRHADVLAARVGAIAIVASAGGISPPLAAWHRVAPAAAGLVVAGHTALNKAGRPIIPASSAAERATQVVFGQHPDARAVRKTHELSRAMDPHNFVSLLPELVGFDERAAFEDLPVPCVVVAGDRDRVTPPRYASALHETLPGSRLLVWRGAGHMLMYERREALDELLDELSAEAATGRGVPVGPD
jgi:pimeloyl-ACP methyl ester carboxylesterase